MLEAIGTITIGMLSIFVAIFSYRTMRAGKMVHPIAVFKKDWDIMLVWLVALALRNLFHASRLQIAVFMPCAIVVAVTINMFIAHLKVVDELKD